ncbi:magnesium chelatase subunit D family protein [Knoellia subterranea]|uniref:Mg-protoporphyrin IX chelatase n=1 Tax=Knoellia subterranea KCTC 19937 TaxID=1385521 RepID=A0A0A0JME5_9MICO|nr:magnesium chelatase subunit D family protein [Knoellia subterranea]KGN36806.1 magnesium chelatase [Knoellia subterranea KCTC 19937]
MTHYPFTAVVGSDDLSLALILTTVSPGIGGVLVRGEKGTAKSTIVRGLVELLPAHDVVEGCRFGCDPARPDPTCPDGPHAPESATTEHPARLVELPVGATEDRVIGSLDLGKALGSGEAAFQPGLLADAHRGILYVDEVNLLHDHLVDLLLDAAAMGRNTVERDGVSVSHAARLVLVGTMNPEEGELRPQLLDRFGLTVEVAASRDPQLRAEVVRRRLAFDADPVAFSDAYAAAQRDLADRVASARSAVESVELSDWALSTIARVCAGFEVDGMRADIVTARAAMAHAAWHGRTSVAREDVRAAAIFALPHRRRRNPFDAPGLDEDLLERLLDEVPEPTDPTDPSEPTDPSDKGPQGKGPSDGPDKDGPDGGPSGGPDKNSRNESQQNDSQQDADLSETPTPEAPEPGDGDSTSSPDEPAAVPVGVAAAGAPFRARALTLTGLGTGEAGRRSRALTSTGHTIGATTGTRGRVHLLATITEAARHRGTRGTAYGRLSIQPADLRTAVTQGQESNLVLLAVDASGSMGARKRMEEVKTAVLSLLLDAYQRRDRVGLVTFRGTGAEVALHPTSSVDAAARSLATLPHGGRTPLAEGLLTATKVLAIEKLRDPKRRPLLVVVTDGRATSGSDALERARAVADAWGRTGHQAVVIDCETGRFRLGLAAELASRMGATHVPLGEVAAGAIVESVTTARDVWRSRKVA